MLSDTASSQGQAIPWPKMHQATKHKVQSLALTRSSTMMTVRWFLSTRNHGDPQGTFRSTEDPCLPAQQQDLWKTNPINGLAPCKYLLKILRTSASLSIWASVKLIGQKKTRKDGFINDWPLVIPTEPQKTGSLNIVVTPVNIVQLDTNTTWGHQLKKSN